MWVSWIFKIKIEKRKAIYIYTANNEARSCNYCCRGKAISITYSECVSVALGIQPWNAHAPSHLWPVPLYNILPHYLIKGTIKKSDNYWTQKVFWFSLQLLSETFLTLRNERDMIINVRGFSRKVTDILMRGRKNVVEQHSQLEKDVLF